MLRGQITEPWQVGALAGIAVRDPRRELAPPPARHDQGLKVRTSADRLAGSNGRPTPTTVRSSDATSRRPGDRRR